MDKKKIIISFSLLALFLTIMALALWAIQKEPSEQVKLEQTKQEIIENAETKNINDEGFVNASLISKPENYFQITYQEEPDLFSINIDTGGREASEQRTKEEVEEIRNFAENYFVKDFLGLQNKQLACDLNVRIVTIGYGHRLPVSKLSFCE